MVPTIVPWKENEPLSVNYGYDRMPLRNQCSTLSTTWPFPRIKDKVGVKYHLERNGDIVPNSRHCAFYTINTLTGLIESCYDVVEPVQKTGEANLAVLNAASKIIGKGDKGH